MLPDCGSGFALGMRRKFQSPEGDSGLCYSRNGTCLCKFRGSFSPPKGIQVFVTRPRQHPKRVTIQVSVPRRGFRSLLRTRTVYVERKPPQVSVPRRGFRSLLRFQGNYGSSAEVRFQSPEGDSGLCYLYKRAALPSDAPSFSPPKGIQVFVTLVDGKTGVWIVLCFSPPKGIQVFVTRDGSLGDSRDGWFQSPEGDSGLCYCSQKTSLYLASPRFSSRFLASVPTFRASHFFTSPEA